VAGVRAFDPQGRLLGFAEAHDDIDKACWDAAFTVVPEARGRGIGSALAREVAAAARAKGARRVIAVTESDNRAMIKVGEKIGRRVTSRGVWVDMEIGVDPPPDLGSAPLPLRSVKSRRCHCYL